MKVLVTGATGFVGRAAQSRLKDHDLVAALWKEEEARLLPQQTKGIVIGSIGSATNWDEALQGVDAVLHLAGRAHILKETEPDPMAIYREVNRDATLHLARSAVRAGVKRLVFVSSIGVFGRGQGMKDPGKGYAVGDSTHPEDDYAVSKLEAEEGLKEIDGIEKVVIRPPLVHGPGAPGNLRSLMGLVWKGLPLPFGLVQNKRSLVSLANLTDFFGQCLEHPNAAGKTFAVADKEIVSTREILQALAKGMERPLRLLPMPVSLLGSAARLAGKTKTFESLFGNLVVDGSHARQALNWDPPQTTQEGLMEAGSEYRKMRGGS